MSRRWTCATIVSLLLLVPVVEANGLDLGVVGGIQKSKDADDAGYIIGAMARTKFLKLIGIEGLAGYRTENYDNDALKVESYPLMLTGYIQPIPLLYFGLGAGWYITSYEFDEEEIKLDTTNDFGWHLCAGVEFGIGGVKLIGDLRYVFLDYDFSDVPFEEVSADFYWITVGLLFDL